MNKGMFIFALSFFSMTLFCAEASREGDNILGKKRKLPGEWQHNQAKIQSIEDQDDDIKMERESCSFDVSHIQEQVGIGLFSKRTLGIKRKFSSELGGSQAKIQVIEDQDDDIEMEPESCSFDVSHIQKSSGDDILKYALQFKEENEISRCPIDACIKEIKQAMDYIAMSRREMEKLLSQLKQFNFGLFFSNEDDLENGDSIIALSRLLQGGEQKVVGSRLEKIGLEINFCQAKLNVNKRVLEAYR